MRQLAAFTVLALLSSTVAHAQTTAKPEPFPFPDTKKTPTPPDTTPAGPAVQQTPTPSTGPGITVPKESEPFPFPNTLSPQEKAAQVPAKTTAPAMQSSSIPTLATDQEKRMRGIAERFAPVIHHRQAGSAEEHRFDFPTLFDFDGDWIGNNNWAHGADPKYKLYSYVYYSALETEDYYFLHYALYHPRDWSVVQGAYESVLDSLQQKIGDILNTKTREEVEFNHENDLEGVLLVVRKEAGGTLRAIAMETVAHNKLLRYVAEDSGLEVPPSRPKGQLRIEDGRPVIYVQSQKHGIYGYGGEQSSANDPIVVFRPGPAIEFSQMKGGEATYDLVPIHLTFWLHAKTTHEPDLTFGTVTDFGDTFCAVGGTSRPGCVVGKIGDALKGDFARPNSAHAPWGWFDTDDPRLVPGSWFFDPVQILQRHFGQFDLEQKYLYNPYLGIAEQSAAPESKP